MTSIQPEEGRQQMNDYDLLYAATVRCACGAGMACPQDNSEALRLRAWVCSDVLKGADAAGHDRLDFALYKVREETSINNMSGSTTRPPGTVCLTVGKAKCPKCQQEWESEPYNACGLNHHWFSGPCPQCGYAVGSAGMWSSTQGEPIEHRYSDVVRPEPAP